MKVIGKIVKNFTLLEMMNKLAREAVQLKLTPELVEHAQMMQELRDWAVVTFPKVFGKNGLMVSSWYRTKAFNKSCGGASNSCHLDGLATDVKNIPSNLYDEFINAWQVICSNHNKIGGIELYTWGMHFDSDSGRYGTKVFRIKDNRKK